MFSQIFGKTTHCHAGMDEKYKSEANAAWEGAIAKGTNL